jgi:hypothetical protein
MEECDTLWRSYAKFHDTNSAKAACDVPVLRILAFRRCEMHTINAKTNRRLASLQTLLGSPSRKHRQVHLLPADFPSWLSNWK